ncbi:MAG: flagellar hook-basal body complex protein FliE [Sporomusaceae bacterium]|nr:flagellar hook-basal body complex protein FliE [Sporomusaceae bacterium]
MKIDAIKPVEFIREAAAPEKTAVSGEADFGQVLSAALNTVNRLQQDSAKASVDLATGRIQDISQVTIASEKATVALQLTMQVRNKVVDAYQEIMRMQM